MNFSVPPVEYIVTLRSFSFFTIGAYPSLLKTEISADDMVLLLIVLCCEIDGAKIRIFKSKI